MGYRVGVVQLFISYRTVMMIVVDMAEAEAVVTMTEVMEGKLHVAENLIFFIGFIIGPHPLILHSILRRYGDRGGGRGG